ncbi:MAG TPA: response regulator [Anaerolineae bacterium]
MSSSEKRVIKLVVSEDVPFQHRTFVRELGVFADIDVVGEAWNPDQALEVVTQLKPDVVLFDLRYKGWDKVTVFETIRAMREISPDTRLLALTAYAGELGEGALQAGCDRVMEKDVGVDIREVHAAIVTLGGRPRKHRATWKDIRATRAEIDAFMAFLRTRSRKAAAERRGVDEDTQKNQEQAIRHKLATFSGEDVSNMGQAIPLAVALGLIDLDDFEQDPGASQ